MAIPASDSASDRLDLGLRDSVVIVSGAGSGIGRAVAQRLAAAGARVALVGRRPQPLRQSTEAIEQAGGRALTVPADVADPATPARVLKAVYNAFGQIDGLVNNAALCRHHPLAEWEMAGFDEHVATNVRAPYFLTQAALPFLAGSAIGSVVNIGSSSGALRLPGQSVYGMTKSALNYLTQSLAAELAPTGVRVNCLAPGPVDTPIHATWAEDLEQAHAWLKAQVPLGRIADPAEIAQWVALLLSPISSFMTGAVIPLDGGQVA